MKRPLIERFMEKVMPEPNTGCWFWVAACNRNGYGKIIVNGVNSLANRISYQLFNGELNELYVLHTCDNPSCVNPQHLYLGDQFDNMKDMKSRGRAKPLYGNKNHAKLTRNQVDEIRASTLKPSVLAKKYNVTHDNINLIKRFATWK